MKKMTIIGLTLFVFLAFSGADDAPAQIGQRIDRALDRIGTDLREGWEEARGAVNRMGLQARVYSRLHWDKDLQDATLDIEVRSADEVLLRGSVADESAKRKAVQLARQTVGVASVVDELAVAPAAAPQGRANPQR